MMKTLSLEYQKMPTWVKNFSLIGCGSILLGLSAHIAIFLPFSPVPIVFQNFLVLVLAMLFGSQRGFLIVLTFLIQGIVGLPVFAGGASELVILMGPRGGYLLGYLFAAYLVGKMAEKNQKDWITLLVGNFVIYLLGSLQLSLFVGIENVMALGVVPFLIGDGLKAIGYLFALRMVELKF